MPESAEVVDLKQKTLSILDADADGKLTFEDAKQIALTTSGYVSEAAKAQLRGWLDTDGDGSISWTEAQEGARATFHKCEEKVTRLITKLKPYRNSLLCAGGYIACFYGSNFKYTILFSRTFATTGWPSLGPALEELAASYDRGKKAYIAAAPELKEAAATIRSEVSSAENPKQALVDNAGTVATLLNAMKGVFLAVDPKKLVKVLKSAYVGISASFAGVLSDSAARLGIGVSLGDSIATAINSIIGPIIKRGLTRLRTKTLNDPTVQDAIHKQQVIDDSTLDSWLDAIISFLSTCFGVYVAHRVDDVIYLYSACVAGATVAVERAIVLIGLSLDPNQKPRLSPDLRIKLTQLAVWSLAASGFVYQRILNKGKIPFILKLPLSPLALVEATLNSMALSFRASKAV